MIFANNIKGNVAEAGVFQGDFSSVINSVFHPRKLYLFDTFEGFDEKDVYIEKVKHFSNAKAGHLSDTSIEFWPKMAKGGIMVIHDYYAKAYKGIRECVDSFCKKEKRTPFPIGDSISIAVQK